MLGFESEKQLARFLIEVQQGENRIEQARQRLCSTRDFAPYSAFMRLDRDANEYLTPYEILNFLRDNREYTITLRECESLVKFFDTDGDNCLKFNE